jgi:hypothetical protein
MVVVDVPLVYNAVTVRGMPSGVAFQQRAQLPSLILGTTVSCTHAVRTAMKISEKHYTTGIAVPDRRLLPCAAATLTSSLGQ